MKKKNFLQRAYTVMEIRTGFATGLPVLSGGLFGAYLAQNLKIIPLLLMFMTGFCLNIVANVANELRVYRCGYLNCSLLFSRREWSCRTNPRLRGPKHKYFNYWDFKRLCSNWLFTWTKTLYCLSDWGTGFRAFRWGD